MSPALAPINREFVVGMDPALRKIWDRLGWPDGVGPNDPMERASLQHVRDLLEVADRESLVNRVTAGAAANQLAEALGRTHAVAIDVRLVEVGAGLVDGVRPKETGIPTARS